MGTAITAVAMGFAFTLPMALWEASWFQRLWAWLAARVASEAQGHGTTFNPTRLGLLARPTGQAWARILRANPSMRVRVLAGRWCAFGRPGGVVMVSSQTEQGLIERLEARI